ncbi:hypothetical protein EGC77_16245 [Shewanella psychromarinicola]|uniref:Uncharacterized protein n=1 Tax=Shewanella psychromarinicola TaxID=2487742 RepID=A0A3N4DT35_9GAMM|nr:hypothetical protein EGC77_16245 [Shewanella psychromarinicola]
MIYHHILQHYLPRDYAVITKMISGLLPLIFCVAKPKKGRIAIEKLKSVSDDSYFNPLSGNR